MKVQRFLSGIQHARVVGFGLYLSGLRAGAYALLLG